MVIIISKEWHSIETPYSYFNGENFSIQYFQCKWHLKWMKCCTYLKVISKKHFNWYSIIEILFILHGMPLLTWFAHMSNYIPWNMHMVLIALFYYAYIELRAFAWYIYLNSSALLYWHWGNYRIAPVPGKYPWNVWVKLTVPHWTTIKYYK